MTPRLRRLEGNYTDDPLRIRSNIYFIKYQPELVDYKAFIIFVFLD